MDRFSWISSTTQLQAGELFVLQQRGLRIYDGENKVSTVCPRKKATL